MSPPLPIALREARQRGWHELDVVLVSGDAYVDHPAFAAAMLGRVLEDAGFRVGILSQPDWRSAEPFRALGRPRLFFGICPGNVDSMVAHYTPRRRLRSDDPFSAGGAAGNRPDRAAAVYAQRCREAYRGVPVVVGGIEASLRRVAHWDHWSRTVRPSVLVSSKADLLVYGMGEERIVTVARALDGGAAVAELRALESTCSLLGKRDAEQARQGDLAGATELPSFEQCRDDPARIADVTRAVCLLTAGDPPLVQPHGDRLVVHRPPAPPPARDELDRWFALPFTRREHPALPAKVPALETVRWSVVTHRGCFGGCSFCSLAEHQGRHVVSRSPRSIVDELRRMARDPDFRGTVSDLGGPSANMYGLGCGSPGQEARCRRRSCLWPRLCTHLVTDPAPWLDLLRRARRVDGVKSARVASGVRMDLLLRHPESLAALTRHHVGGQLKVAPEHDAAETLTAMRKYAPGTLRRFKAAYDRASRSAGREQYLVAYLMSGHPGTTPEAMAALAEELRDLGLRPRQVQDFTPTPMTPSTAQHVSGRDPLTGKATAPVRGDRARADQRTLLQAFLPENRERAARIRRQLDGKPAHTAPGRRRGRRR
jgi:uncharacterized radical SAM protein YgiQ